MATKKSMSKSARKVTKKQHTPDYYPVVKKITLGVDGGSITGTMVGDAGRLLSISNRRLYRYAKNYQIKLDLDIPNTLGTDAAIEVYALANNWDVQRALALAKSIYDQAHEEELRVAGGSSARWRDFRVSSGTGGSLLSPVTFDNATLATNVQTTGEFSPSSVDKAGTRTYFTWGAATVNQIDILNEWIESGRTSDSPATFSTTAPYQGVNSDSASDLELEGVNTEGNDAPYSPSGLSDQLVKVATLYFRPGAIGMQKMSTGFFDAPCGLFILKSATNISNGTVQLAVKSGDYKGVHALSMCQE